MAAGQRWSAGRKREVVLRMLPGDSLDALSRELGMEIYRLEEWRDKALSGMDLGLKNRQDDPLSHELDAAKRHIAELSMEFEKYAAVPAETQVELKKKFVSKIGDEDE